MQAFHRANLSGTFVDAVDGEELRGSGTPPRVYGGQDENKDGIMEKNMETTIEYRGYMGRMEDKMENAGLLGLYRGYRGIYWGSSTFQHGMYRLEGCA